MIDDAIRGLVEYGLETGLIEREDAIYARNQILDVMGLSEYREPETPKAYAGLEEILKELLDDACARGLLESDSVVYRDLFDTRLMNCLMPRPSAVTREVWTRYGQSPETATEYYSKLSQDSDYIRGVGIPVFPLCVL